MVPNPGRVRAVKIYTKTGDDGTTGLLGRGRVPKDDLRIAAYGTVDELNALLGVARCHGLDAATDQLVARLQDELFLVGSALADPLPDGRFHNTITPSSRRASRTDDRQSRGRARAAAPVHPARRGACGGPAPPGTHGLPPRRTAGRRALSKAGRSRWPDGARLPESAERSPVRAGPRGQSPAGVADVIWKGI